MSTVTYSFGARVLGSPLGATGLTPTFASFINITNTNSLIGSAPAIVEVGDGHYKFDLDWSNFASVDYISAVIDLGAVVASDNERYIIARLNRNDNFPSVVSESYSSLQKLLQIELGKWEITGNQLILFEEDGVTEIHRFNLFDAAGDPTSSAPSRREPVI